MHWRKRKLLAQKKLKHFHLEDWFYQLFIVVCFLKGKACNVFGNHIIITVNLLEGRLLFLSLINLVVLVNQSSNKIFIGNEIIYNLYIIYFSGDISLIIMQILTIHLFSFFLDSRILLKTINLNYQMWLSWIKSWVSKFLQSVVSETNSKSVYKKLPNKWMISKNK